MGVFQFYGKFASSQPRLFTAGLGKRPFHFGRACAANPFRGAAWL